MGSFCICKKKEPEIIRLFLYLFNFQLLNYNFGEMLIHPIKYLKEIDTRW